MNIKQTLFSMALLALTSNAFASELSLFEKIEQVATSDDARTVSALREGNSAIQIMQLKRLSSIDKNLVSLQTLLRKQNNLAKRNNDLLEHIEYVLHSK